MEVKPTKSKPFEQGDGFNVYIDFTRFLPDNTTITTVQTKLVSRDGKDLGHEWMWPDLDDALCVGTPSYDLAGRSVAKATDGTDGPCDPAQVQSRVRLP